MTTSGTVGQLTVQVITIIEHAVRRCGKLPSTMSGELLLAAKENLALALTDLVNDGISLWCIQTVALPCLIGKMVYTLPPGTADVLSVNYRTQTALTGDDISGTGWVGVRFAEASSPTNMQIVFTASTTPALVIESSSDEVTWTTVVTLPTQNSALTPGLPLAQDIDNSIPDTSWRVRDTSGALGAGAAVTFSDAPSEVPMGNLNRDDYANLPNKTFQATRPTEYWFDKQIASQIRVWPIPSASTGQIIVQTHRQIQDIGAFSNSIEVPQRWYEHVIFALACRIAAELPRGELEPGKLEYLEGKAESSKSRAEDGETDGAPFRIQPNLNGYT